MTLKESPKEFCAALLKPFRALLMPPTTGGQDWVIYCSSDFEVSTLGICGNKGVGQLMTPYGSLP